MKIQTRYCLGFLVLFLSLPGLLSSQNAASPASAAVAAAPRTVASPHTPLEFFARARQLSDLEAAGIPFHLKATYLATGDAEFTGNGTIEEWWQSKDLWRKEATLGDYRWVELQNGAEPSVYSTSAYVPLRLRQAVGAFPLRFPSAASASSDWQMGHRRLNNVDLTALSRQYTPEKANSQIKVNQTDYFTSEGVLRIRQTGGIVTVYNQFEQFQNLMIPHSLSIGFFSVPVVAISITGLDPSNADQRTMSEIAALPKNLNPAGPYFREPSRAMAGRLIHYPATNYPAAARQQRIEGTVIIEASIDETGKVREPYVLSSASPLLSDAALDAIRKYRYNPATIDGKPVVVGTTISFNFSLNY